MIKPGDTLHLTRAASPQFVRPITVRVIRVIDNRYPPYGWTWLDAYELNARGDATRRRELFVLVDGVQRLTPRPAGFAGAPCRPRQQAPAKAGA